MIRHPIAAAAVALLMTTGAHATVVFDSVTTGSPAAWSGLLGDGSNYLGQSFNVTQTEAIYSIQLAIAADAPGDGYSTSVYILPYSAIDSSGDPADTSGLNPIASISDASLGSTQNDLPFPLVSLSFAPQVLTAGTYWLYLDTSNYQSYSSIEWAYNSNAGGEKGNPVYTDANGVLPGDGGAGELPDGAGPGTFEAIIAAPEPATAALLGVGLAGLGLVRRRATGKA